ncbi:hypothetical protein Q3G72_024109 [Acer saccharum]|nr:hypothetical protein Q3G72_024109 [Acer saccharum]
MQVEDINHVHMSHFLLQRKIEKERLGSHSWTSGGNYSKKEKKRSTGSLVARAMAPPCQELAGSASTL